MQLKDYLLSFVAAYLMKLLVMKTVEEFLLVDKRYALKQNRQAYIQSMASPCFGANNDETGGAECAGHRCFVLGGTGELYCKTEADVPSSAMKINNPTDEISRNAFLNEFAPEGWSTSQRERYALAFILGATLLCKFMLISDMPKDIDEEYDRAKAEEAEAEAASTTPKRRRRATRPPSATAPTAPPPREPCPASPSTGPAPNAR